MNNNNLILPQKLNPGDTIGIISPAGAVKKEADWDKVKSFFAQKGYKVKISSHSKDKKAYLAGEDSNRLQDLMDFFRDDEVKAIMCSRGGYGTYRLLENIEYEVIRQNPKIFVGYSDITALLCNFLEKSNLVTFHGPLALSDFGVDVVDEYTKNNFFEILEGKANISYSYSNPLNYECINAGEAEGVLIGGNLTVLCGLLGTPYFPDLTGKILLLEDVAEPLYKIDRMLTQLKLAGVFNRISALLFGEFTSIPESSDPDIDKLTSADVIKDILGEVNIPVGIGFPASHGKIKATLPVGVRYYFNSQDFKLEIREKYLN